MIIKQDGDSWIEALTSLLRGIKNGKLTASSWSESLMVSIFEKGTYGDYRVLLDLKGIKNSVDREALFDAVPKNVRESVARAAPAYI